MPTTIVGNSQITEDSVPKLISVDQATPFLGHAIDTATGLWLPLQSTGGALLTSGGGSGSGNVTVTNFPATQPVSIATTVATNSNITNASLPVTGTFWQATQPVNGTVTLGAGAAAVGSVSVSNFPATQPVSGTVNVGTRGWTLASGTDSVTIVPSGTQAVSIAGTVATNANITNASLAVTGTVALGAGAAAIGSVSVSNFPATQPVSGTVTANRQAVTSIVTGTAAANTALTITLPAVASQFHYITAIEIRRTATAALTGSATLAVTTTNLPGSLAWSFGNAMVAGGTQNDLTLVLNSPIKSSVVNTATTIVMPAPGAAVLWRANVYYYTGT
jgi:hypothetical protein